MTGDIMKISRLRMGTDGKGVSTLVVFFGCPLDCKHCANDFCHEKNGWDGVARGEYSPEELVEVMKKDELYYLMSGGGVVFGGGEPLLQSSFIHEACQIIDGRWKKRIETSLNTDWGRIDPLLWDMDKWIVDIKDMNPEIYRKYTGEDNKRVIRNLLQLKDTVGKEKIHVRVPHIFCYNNEGDVQKSAEWVRENIGVEPEVFDYVQIPKADKRITD